MSRHAGSFLFLLTIWLVTFVFAAVQAKPMSGSLDNNSAQKLARYLHRYKRFGLWNAIGDHLGDAVLSKAKSSIFGSKKDTSADNAASSSSKNDTEGVEQFLELWNRIPPSVRESLMPYAKKLMATLAKKQVSNFMGIKGRNVEPIAKAVRTRHHKSAKNA